MGFSGPREQSSAKLAAATVEAYSVTVQECTVRDQGPRGAALLLRLWLGPLLASPGLLLGAGDPRFALEPSGLLPVGLCPFLVRTLVVLDKGPSYSRRASSPLITSEKAQCPS